MGYLCNVHAKSKYCIHFNNRPGHLDKSFRMGGYLFQYWLQGSTQKFMILAIFWLIPNQIELGMLVLWKDLGRWLIILWFIVSKYDGCSLIGVWAAI